MFTQTHVGAQVISEVSWHNSKKCRVYGRLIEIVNGAITQQAQLGGSTFYNVGLSK
jgi:hypothetical protein